jgi:hypothetical protein
MLRRHGADELHNDHGLASTCATENAGLATFGERSDEIDHFDASLKHVHTGGLFRKRGRRAMDRVARRSFHWALLVYRLTQHIENTSQGRLPHWNENGRSGGPCRHAALQAIS